MIIISGMELDTDETVANEITRESEREIVAIGGEEGLGYGGAWRRLVALLIDIAVIFMITIIVSLIFGTGDVAVWLMFAIIVIYFVGSWARWGQTLGKKIMGARIVKANGDPIGWGRALLRFICLFWYFWFLGYILSLVVLLVIFIIIGISSKKRGIHDIIAGTYVVKSR